MLHLTFDIDWAPDFILEDVLHLLESKCIHTTFFATHTTPLHSTIALHGHEIGIHPNFNPHFDGAGRPYRVVIDELLGWFPNAVGVRFHSLGKNAHVIKYCAERGIRYDSSIYIPQAITPFQDYGGIFRIPFQYADLQLVLNGDLEIDWRDYSVGTSWIFVFHPVHIFLNTISWAHYQEAKSYFRNPRKLEQYRCHDQRGVRTLLQELLQQPAEQFQPLRTLVP